MEEEAGRTIGQALALSTTITRLNLNGNSVGEGGGRAIGQALAVNTTLSYLFLDEVRWELHWLVQYDNLGAESRRGISWARKPPWHLECD